MDIKNNRRKGKIRGNMLLLGVLIVFCILAIIEILYGHAQIRRERERAVLDEEKSHAVQELEDAWNKSPDDQTVVTEPETNTETDGNEPGDNTENSGDKPEVNTENPEDESGTDTESGDDKPAKTEQKYDMQIVFMGDSIIDSDRENGGVAYLVSQACNARVYNLSIGGTTAALLPDEQFNFDEWSSIGFLGIVHAILGHIDAGVFDRYKAGQLLKECDFSQTDYFVVEYGINDFLCRQVARSKYLDNGEVLKIDDLHTYVGALDAGVRTLLENFPEAKVVLIAPHYCQIFEGSAYLGDSYTLDYGAGTLLQYYNMTEYVAYQYKQDQLLFFDTLRDSGIDAYTADDYMEDGIHLSAEGRKVYADHISRLILADFYPEE